MKTQDIALKEMDLNIEHQLEKVDYPIQFAYEFEKGHVVCGILIPNVFKKGEGK